jgi:hypothetical protein
VVRHGDGDFVGEQLGERGEEVAKVSTARRRGLLARDGGFARRGEGDFADPSGTRLHREGHWTLHETTPHCTKTDESLCTHYECAVASVSFARFRKSSGESAKNGSMSRLI